MALDDVNEGGTPYMGISPREPEREREQPINTLHPAGLHRTHSGTTSLKKSVLVVRER